MATHDAWCSNWSSSQSHFRQVAHWKNRPPHSNTERAHSAQTAPASAHEHACVWMHRREWQTQTSQKSHVAPTNASPVADRPGCLTRQSPVMHFVRPHCAHMTSFCSDWQK
eukprot:Amastigsp_a3537_18.p3 type:complete len:111 gc:universal Amastigsp_a3537_18:470-802(+)